MEYEEIGDVDGVPIRAPKDDSYRTCPECGKDCPPEPTAVDGLDLRIAFICPEHGLHSVIDPFEEDR